LRQVVCVQSLAYVWLAWGNSKQIPHNPGIFDGVRTLPPPPKKKEKQHTKKRKTYPEMKHHHYVTTKLALKLATHYINQTMKKIIHQFQAVPPLSPSSTALLCFLRKCFQLTNCGLPGRLLQPPGLCQRHLSS
jgi:hypothetical protein